MTPDALVLRWKIPGRTRRAPRRPPDPRDPHRRSATPAGHRAAMAMSMILWIFVAWASPSAPPKIRKSCAYTKTVRPRPCLPAGDHTVRVAAWPPGRSRPPGAGATRSTSLNDPSSRSSSIAPRAVSLPLRVLGLGRLLTGPGQRLGTDRVQLCRTPTSPTGLRFRWRGQSPSPYHPVPSCDQPEEVAPRVAG